MAQRKGDLVNNESGTGPLSVTASGFSGAGRGGKIIQ